MKKVFLFIGCIVFTAFMSPAHAQFGGMLGGGGGGTDLNSLVGGTIDVAAERARLTKDLATASKDRETAISKLENSDFMAKAPEKVVATIKERLATCDAEILRINERLSALVGS